MFSQFRHVQAHPSFEATEWTISPYRRRRITFVVVVAFLASGAACIGMLDTKPPPPLTPLRADVPGVDVGQRP